MGTSFLLGFGLFLTGLELVRCRIWLILVGTLGRASWYDREKSVVLIYLLVGWIVVCRFTYMDIAGAILRYSSCISSLQGPSCGRRCRQDKASLKHLISHPHTARGCLVPAVQGVNSRSRWSSDAKRTTAV
jgi:hypothetical protein